MVEALDVARERPLVSATPRLKRNGLRLLRLVSVPSLMR